jgi:copper resistance protein D
MLLFQAAVLWVHLFSAVLFVGGSFFMWMVVVPASHLITQDESERTQIVGKIAKAFGKIAIATLVILVLTGIYNATWYLSSFSDLFNTSGGMILLTKSVLVVVLIVLIFLSNVYFGRRVVQLAREKRIDELKVLRRRSRLVSFTNLGLMIVILVLAVLMQDPL